MMSLTAGLRYVSWFTLKPTKVLYLTHICHCQCANTLQCDLHVPIVHTELHSLYVVHVVLVV